MGLFSFPPTLCVCCQQSTCRWALKRQEISLLGKSKNPSVAAVLPCYSTLPAPPEVPACCKLSPELTSPSPRQDAVSTLLYGYLGNTLAHKLCIPNDVLKTCNADICVQSAFTNESRVAFPFVSDFSS